MRVYLAGGMGALGRRLVRARKMPLVGAGTGVWSFIQVVVRWMTEARGASNEKAKRALDWRPAWTSGREGFRYGLASGDDPPVATPEVR